MESRNTTAQVQRHIGRRHKAEDIIFCLQSNKLQTFTRLNYWNTYAGNIFLFLFSGGILVLARLFPIDRFPLGFCVLKYLTGFPCPTCGFTRAFCDFANGNWADGFYLCPFAFIVFVLAALVFIYNASVITAGLFGQRILPGKIMRLSSKKTVLLAVVFFLLLMANWIYRLVMGLS